MSTSDKTDTPEEKVVEQLRLFMRDLNGSIHFHFYDAVMPQVRARANEIIKEVLSEKRTIVDLNGKLLTVLRLADELTSAIDNEAEDIGGQRPSGMILRELGPAVEDANEAIRAAKAEA